MEIYVISICRKQFYQLKTVDITKSTKIEISKRTDNSFSVKGPFKGPFVGPFFFKPLPTRNLNQEVVSIFIFGQISQFCMSPERIRYVKYFHQKSFLECKINESPSCRRRTGHWSLKSLANASGASV